MYIVFNTLIKISPAEQKVLYESLNAEYLLKSRMSVMCLFINTKLINLTQFHNR